MTEVAEKTRLGAIRRAIYDLGGDPELQILVCHGPPWCLEDQTGAPRSCLWCHVITGDDHRSPQEIENDIEAQQRDH